MLPFIQIALIFCKYLIQNTVQIFLHHTNKQNGSFRSLYVGLVAFALYFLLFYNFFMYYALNAEIAVGICTSFVVDM